MNRTILILVALALTAAPVSAHDVVVEQVVDILIQPHGDRLVVNVHAPATVIGKAPVASIAADIARNLDIRQGDAGLGAPAIVARAGADGSSIDPVFKYAMLTGAGGLSARLNEFQSTAGPARSNVRFQPADGAGRIVSVTGPSARVALEPTVLEAAREFLARGVRAIFDGGDQLLFLVCLFLSIRRGRDAVTVAVALCAGQAVAIVASALAPSLSGAWVVAAATIAASAVVVAALQTIVSADLRWVTPLAAAFGAANGMTFGNTGAHALQLAGAHQLTAIAVFLVAVAGVEGWLAALLWMTRNWLAGFALPARMLSLVAAVAIAHTAVHRASDRADLLAQAGTFASERALLWLTLGWAIVMLAVAAIEAMHGRVAHEPQPDAEAAQS